MKEKIAAFSVLVILLAVPVAVIWYQFVHIPSKFPQSVKVFDITAVARTGTWTLEKVHGLNYWCKRFSPMTLHLEVGEQALLRLRSADVFHRFYVPDLNIGPVDVQPERMAEVSFRADKAGVFQYYCTAQCGNCHFYMSGWIVVTPKGEVPVTPEPIVCPLCFPGFDRPGDDELIPLGEHLYLAKGCNTCHGMEGRGGVKNPNFSGKTVPAHNTTAEKFLLEEEEDVEAFLELLQQHADLDQVVGSTEIPRFFLVLSRYKAAKEIITKGKLPAKFDPAGPEPPLQMPSWQAILSERDMDALLSYFLSLYPWEEDEEEGFPEDEAWSS